MSHGFPDSRKLARQRGIAGMMTMLFLLVVVGFSAVTLLNMAGSDLHDTTAQNDSVAALFLAESGIERASQLYATGTSCNTLVPTSPPPLPPPVVFGRGSVTYTGVAPVVVAGLPASCRVQSRGVVGNTTRTIEVDLQRGPALGDITYLSASSAATASALVQWNHNIPATAGPNRLVVVGVSIRGASSVFSATYDGVPMTTVSTLGSGLPPPAVNGAVRVEWLYAKSPRTGNRQVRVVLSAAARAVAGAFAFSGVDLVTPVDTSALGTGNYPSNPGVSVTPVTDKAWVVDVLAVQLNTTVTAGPGQTNPAAWRRNSGGGPAAGVYGAGSYRGPVSPIATVPMAWTLSPTPPVPPPTHAWAHSVLALRPVPLLHIVRWTEL